MRADALESLLRKGARADEGGRAERHKDQQGKPDHSGSGKGMRESSRRPEIRVQRGASSAREWSAD
jgi:hypothetical protein